MAKIWVEVCLISARGLRRSSSLWKLQWYAVGWIDPNNKYCSKIDASGNANPVWKTKFATLVDDSKFQEMALNVEVYSREPLFLRERLQGTTTIVLKEFLTKYSKTSDGSRPGNDEAGSYQLRKRNSNKPQGFVDVSVRVSEERDESSSYPGNEGGIVLTDNTNITLSIEDGSEQTYPNKPAQFPFKPVHRTSNQSHSNFPNTTPTPYPINYSNPFTSGPSHQPTSGPNHQPAGGPIYRPPGTPPPPPPPSNVGYIPTFLPSAGNYVNMASSGAPGRGRGPSPGFGMGLGAGAMAAGAVIFGDDFMSGFDVPSRLQDASLSVSIDPPL